MWRGCNDCGIAVSQLLCLLALPCALIAYHILPHPIPHALRVAQRSTLHLHLWRESWLRCPLPIIELSVNQSILAKSLLRIWYTSRNLPNLSNNVVTHRPQKPLFAPVPTHLVRTRPLLHRSAPIVLRRCCKPPLPVQPVYHRKPPRRLRDDVLLLSPGSQPTRPHFP
ncbi:hypothetical protein VTI74DRAFT_6254 [Chaetomium olivicolor]